VQFKLQEPSGKASPLGSNHVHGVLGFQMSEVCSYRCSRNIVATANMGCQLDLKAIAMQARNAEYNPKVSRTLQRVLVGVFIVQLSTGPEHYKL
jgi:hypothetical protein